MTPQADGARTTATVRSERDARLDRAYSLLPSVECKGLCFDSCGPIGCTRGEAERMEEAAGAPLTFDRATLKCGYLVDNRCSVYDARPFICRLFGVGASPLMRCPFGCKPSRPVDEMSAKLIQRRLEKIGGESVLSQPARPS